MQNVVITLDKVKRYLRQPGQPQDPPLQLLSDEQAQCTADSALPWQSHQLA